MTDLAFLLRWLRENDEALLEQLWQQADEIRKRSVGDEVHLRGLIEISSFCVRRCTYCGLRADNSALERYRMSEDEIMECVHQAIQFGYGTVVMQSGEDYGIQSEWMSGIIQRIKKETSLAVTLSLGERPEEDLCAWRRAGADRYLLRFETSDPDLYRRIHPARAGQIHDRLAMLNTLRELGFEVGSGVMIGIPGQSYDILARDILTFQSMDLDMIGVGPYIPHPETPLAQATWETDIPAEEQVPNTELMTYKVIALTRLVCPEANIPSTTALATLNLSQGRELGLSRGANIVMPNLTPVQFRSKYEIYPAKACIRESSSDCHLCMNRRINSIGRTVGKGQGGRRRKPDMENTQPIR
ncbi:MAG TPA: [FeFe] hydrogenase H-cluster radical SAM maturase HydE [bacterium]|nr:[FeFe] hydrogenase H-cluster radical SAM maturase HydE [bacterium]